MTFPQDTTAKVSVVLFARLHYPSRGGWGHFVDNAHDGLLRRYERAYHLKGVTLASVWTP